VGCVNRSKYVLVKDANIGERPSNRKPVNVMDPLISKRKEMRKVRW
jgi:hypothetical protein